MNRNDCKNCSWFVDRPKNEREVNLLRNNPNIIIDTRFCALGNCDGSMFIDRHRKAESEVRNETR